VLFIPSEIEGQGVEEGRLLQEHLSQPLRECLLDLSSQKPEAIPSCSTAFREK
jgi:predicted GNAT family acetyltransferase